MRSQKDQVWYHVDVNSAYLSWTAAYRVCILGEDLDLRDLPSVIGGSEAERHGIVLAKSSSAKGYGIRTGETLAEARCKCPGLVIVPPDYSLYVSCSSALVELLKKYFPYVHQYSIDEAFCQVEGTKLMGNAHSVCAPAEGRNTPGAGFYCEHRCVGQQAAGKMASEFQKPDQVHTLFTWEIERKMWPLPVNELFWVGPATARKLRAAGNKDHRGSGCLGFGSVKKAS